MTVFFASDPHIYHRRVIEYCSRPWPDVLSMNEGLIERWNKRVTDDDLVYLLGDVAMNGKKAVDIVARLRGRKRLIRGNHDHDIVKRGAHLFEWVRDYYVASVDHEGQSHKVVLFHFPIEVWDGKHKGVPHFHGHCHGNLNPRRLIKGRVDVGMDCWDWQPVTFGEALARAMSYPGSEAADHHREGEDDPR